jgi:predicted anti-sigma-YlaC factor YlaD
MNEMTCSTVEPLLPDLVHNALQPDVLEEVRAHLESCATCSNQVEFLHRLLLARPEPPQELAGRIQSAVREQSLRTTGIGIPRWAMSAAAIVVLSLGSAIIWQSRGPVEVDPFADLVADPLPLALFADDAMVAGAPSFAGLSDDALEQLLAEMEG